MTFSLFLQKSHSSSTITNSSISSFFWYYFSPSSSSLPFISGVPYSVFPFLFNTPFLRYCNLSVAACYWKGKCPRKGKNSDRDGTRRKVNHLIWPITTTSAFKTTPRRWKMMTKLLLFFYIYFFSSSFTLSSYEIVNLFHCWRKSKGFYVSFYLSLSLSFSHNLLWFRLYKLFQKTKAKINAFHFLISFLRLVYL